MTKKMKLLIVASFLALMGTPILYLGGKDNNPTTIMIGLVVFCLGMGVVLYMKLFAKAPAKTPPSDAKETS